MTSRMRRTVVAFILVSAVAVAACGNDEAIMTSTTQPTTSAVDTTSTTAPTTVPMTSTTAPVSTTLPGSTTTVSGPLPAVVSVITSASGGGSGEITVDWEAVEGATGYRVYRSDTPDGPFEESAEIVVSSGETTLGEGVTNLWSPASDPGEPQAFQYVEVLTSGVEHRYVKVAAFSEAGEGPASVVVCAAPSGGSAC